VCSRRSGKAQVVSNVTIHKIRDVGEKRQHSWLCTKKLRGKKVGTKLAGRAFSPNQGGIEKTQKGRVPWWGTGAGGAGVSKDCVGQMTNGKEGKEKGEGGKRARKKTKKKST